MSVPTIVDPKAVAPAETAGLAPLDVSSLPVLRHIHSPDRSLGLQAYYHSIHFSQTHSCFQ
jgi:hypothetical protein